MQAEDRRDDAARRGTELLARSARARADAAALRAQAAELLTVVSETWEATYRVWEAAERQRSAGPLCGRPGKRVLGNKVEPVASANPGLEGGRGRRARMCGPREGRASRCRGAAP